MSKSLGNVILVHDMLKEWDGEVIRLALLKAHYRSELNWSEDLLKESKAQLDGWYRAVKESEKANLQATYNDDRLHSGGNRGFGKQEFTDLNIPESLGLISSAASIVMSCLGRLAQEPITGDFVTLKSARKRLIDSCEALGLLQKDPEDWFKGGASSDDQAEFDAIAMRRQTARAAKDWAAADAARDEATAKGIVLEDGPDGTTWRKA